MNEEDRKSDKRIAFINFYVAEREFFLPDNLRSALDFIYRLITVKNMDKSLAIHKVNDWYKNKTGVEYGKQYLWTTYNKRMAYIKNATEKYYEWCIEMRKKNVSGVVTCACGCGKPVKKGNKFINGHNIRLRSKSEKIKYAKNMLEKRPSQKNKKKVIHVKFEKAT